MTSSPPMLALHLANCFFLPDPARLERTPERLTSVPRHDTRSFAIATARLTDLVARPHPLRRNSFRQPIGGKPGIYRRRLDWLGDNQHRGPIKRPPPDDDIPFL